MLIHYKNLISARKALFLLLFVIVVPYAQADLTVKEIEYNVSFEGKVYPMQGYLAYDASQETPVPAVLIVHEWWGHNEYARSRARQLAEAGYVAFAIDMYGDGATADHPNDAKKFAMAASSNLPLSRARFEAAKAQVAALPQVNPEQIAAIGYCFGGGMVLQMARLGVDIAAVASFHGSYGTELSVEPDSIKASILVCHGENDAFIPAEHITALKKEMNTANADFTFISYPGAQHSFTNPDADIYGARFELPLAYSPIADKASWNDLLNFLHDQFSAAEEVKK